MRPTIFIPVSLAIGIAIGILLPRPHSHTRRAAITAPETRTASGQHTALDQAAPSQWPVNTSAAPAGTVRSMANGARASGAGAAPSVVHASADTGHGGEDSRGSAVSDVTPSSGVPTDIEESLLLSTDGTFIESSQSDMVLEDDGNFAKLLESMTVGATKSTLGKQKLYASSLQSDPLYASGSIALDNLQCGQKVCALAISSADLKDLDTFIERLGQSKTAPVYAVSSVELADQPPGKRVRRVLISIDPKLRGVSLPQGMSLPEARHTRP